MVSVTRESPTADSAETIDSSWRRLVRIGGVAALLAAVVWLVGTVLMFVSTPPTSGGVQTLQYIAAHRSLYILKQVLWLAPLALTMVMFLAFYLVPERFNRGMALLWVVLGIVARGDQHGVADDRRGLPDPVVLSDYYRAAASATQQAPFAAAAKGLIATNATPAAPGVLESISILVVSLVMLSGGWPRGVAYAGIVTRTLGVISEALRTVLGGAYAVYGTNTPSGLPAHHEEGASVESRTVRLLVAAVLGLHGLGHGGAFVAELLARSARADTGAGRAARWWVLPSRTVPAATALAGVFWTLSLVGFVAAPRARLRGV